jgi:3-hydroxybutyrate dehydrogenase
MKNKIALITGSTSGIGLGIAKHFASLGTNIALHGFGAEDEISKLVQEIESSYKVKCKHYAADMMIPEQIESMMESVNKHFGSIDILVNNAGIQFVSPIESFPNDKWESIIRIDLIASFYTIKHAVPIMKAKGWGRIINIASAHALVASPFKSAYVAAKHGLLGMTKTVALEVGEDDITVNAICPGYVKTPLVLKQIPDTAKARGISEEAVVRDVILASHATKKFVEVEEVAALAAFLCSDAAASITGSGLSIDGGWTAH